MILHIHVAHKHRRTHPDTHTHAHTHTHTYTHTHLDITLTYTHTETQNRNVNRHIYHNQTWHRTRIRTGRCNSTEAAHSTGSRRFSKHQNVKKHGKKHSNCISMELSPPPDRFEKLKRVLQYLSLLKSLLEYLYDTDSHTYSSFLFTVV